MDNLQYLQEKFLMSKICLSFKPCYKWITFNTWLLEMARIAGVDMVLNLVING